MVDTQMIIGLTLTILVTATALSAYNSIRINTLNPQADKLDQVTGQIGRPDINISSKNQLKSTVLFNMLAAADCRLLASYALAEREGDISHVDNVNQIDNINDTIYYQPGEDPDSPDRIDSHDVLSPAFKHGFAGRCAGTGGQGYAIGEAVESGIENTVPGANALDTMDSWFTGSEREFLQEPGQDMEGQFGKINFEINKTDDEGVIKLGTKPSSRFIALRLMNPDNSWIDSNNNKVPSFLMGQAGSGFIPSSLQATDTGLTQTELNPKNQYRNPRQDALYAYNIRIDTEGNRRIIVGNEDAFKDGGSGTNLNNFYSFLSQATWYLCEGDKGYIQSNAGTYSNNVEAGATNDFFKEDTVYPMIKITEAVNCLSNGVEGQSGLRPTADKVELNPASAKTRCSREEALNGASHEFVLEVEYPQKIMDIYCGLEHRNLADVWTKTGNEQIFSGRDFVKYYKASFFVDKDGEKCQKRTYSITSDASTSENFGRLGGSSINGQGRHYNLSRWTDISQIEVDEESGVFDIYMYSDENAEPGDNGNKGGQVNFIQANPPSQSRRFSDSDRVPGVYGENINTSNQAGNFANIGLFREDITTGQEDLFNGKIMSGEEYIGANYSEWRNNNHPGFNIESQNPEIKTTFEYFNSNNNNGADLTTDGIERNEDLKVTLEWNKSISNIYVWRPDNANNQEFEKIEIRAKPAICE